jgi:tight adherence protein C
MTPLLVVAAWFACAAIVYWIGARIAAQHRSVQRLQRSEPFVDQAHGLARRPGPLRRFLDRAGFRSAFAPILFVLTTVCGIAVGAGLLRILLWSGVFDQAIAWLDKMPGGVGQVFEPALYIGPWFLFLMLALAPTLFVRAERRKRVREIEKDLPLVLDLFATLAESGLSFDASLARILDAQPADHALGQELRTYQLEVLAGTGRIECLRRLSRRIVVPSVAIFVSALVQAEQVGAGFAEVLRRQADDLRSRRSERALVSAQALPVKLVFPLILCFLPMIFVSTLGPAFNQFFQLIENATRNLR